MREDRLVSEGEAALVFRRAAELEATSPPEHAARSGFDADTLERIGAEAGLSPAAVRQAVAELQAGRLATRTSRRLGPGMVVIERRLPRPSGTVSQRLETYFRQQQFVVCRRRGPLTIWEPNRSLTANLTRGIDLGDRMRLARVDGIELHVEAEGSATHVRIGVVVTKLRRGARAGSMTGAALGASGVVAAGVGLAIGLPELALFVPFTSVGGTGAFIGARSNYAKKVKRAVDALELVLDELER